MRVPSASSVPLPSVLHRACPRDVSGLGPRHANGWHEVTWVERGLVRFHLGRRSIEACAGECLVLPSGVENQPWVRGVSLHQTWLPTHLVDEALDARGSRGRAPTEVRRFSPSEPFTLVSRALFTAAREGVEADDPGQRALFASLAFELVRGRAEREPRREEPRLRRTLELIAARHAERLTVEDLAEAAGMERFAFFRAFRARFGVSPYRFLVHYRLDLAAAELRAGTGASILDIALACGFTDPGRFAREFRQRFGCAPTRYRQGG